MMRRGWLGMAAAVALAACGPAGGNASTGALDAPSPTKIVDTVCPTLDQLDVEAVLGAGMASATEDAANGVGHPGCTWMGVDQPQGPRVLVATIWRKSRMEPALAAELGATFYEDQKAALMNAYAKVGALEGVGEESLMGLTPLEDGQIEGLIIARKGEDVLSLSMRGFDASAFEAAAVKLAAAM
jgi:hypothetical protein